MTRLLRAAVLLAVVVLLSGCGRDETTPTGTAPRNLTVTEQQLVQSYNAFGLKLFQETVRAKADANVFISPTSVSMALGMTLNGSAGTTEEAMIATLEFADLTMEEINQCYQSLMELLTGLDPAVEFQIANSIWYRLGFPFETEFLETCREYFDADVTELDFASPAAAPTINTWVADNTNDKIKEIVDDPIDPLTVIFLINAMYFYANWTVQFDPDFTVDDWFTLPDGSQAPCKMMQGGDPGDESAFSYSATDGLEIVDMPYGNRLFSMTIVLPGVGADIDSLIAELDEETWGRLIGGLGPQSAYLHMPRFELEYDAKLNDVLKVMGMDVAFDGGADFNRMCNSCGIFISLVKHKTYVKVNEEGTEAAAVTAVSGTTGVGEDITIRVDRPFVFAIRESHSDTILFIGKIVDPGFE